MSLLPPLPSGVSVCTHLCRSLRPSSRPSERQRARAGIQGQVPERLPWTLGSRPRVTITVGGTAGAITARSEEHTSELQSLMRISYAVFCLKKKKIRLHDTL